MAFFPLSTNTAPAFMNLFFVFRHCRQHSTLRESTNCFGWTRQRNSLLLVCDRQRDCKALEQVVRGDVQLVFISPESIIGNHKYRRMLLTPQYQSKLVAIAVDEAHCIKAW